MWPEKYNNVFFWYFSFVDFTFVACRFKLVCIVIKLQCLYFPQATREDLDTYSTVKEYHLEIGYGNTVLTILMYAKAVKYCGLKVFCVKSSSKQW